MSNNCQNCGTALVLAPPEQTLCDWCAKLIGPVGRTRSKVFRYRVSTPDGSFETSEKRHAIRLAKEYNNSWVRDMKTEKVIWPK